MIRFVTSGGSKYDIDVTSDFEEFRASMGESFQFLLETGFVMGRGSV